MKTDDFSTSPSSIEERLHVTADVPNPESKREKDDGVPRLDVVDELGVVPRKSSPAKSSQSLQLVRTFAPDEEKQINALRLLADAPPAESQSD